MAKSPAPETEEANLAPYQRSLDEFARDKTPSSPEVARIQQAVRRAVTHRRPLRRGQLFFAYGGWTVAALAAGTLLLKTLAPSSVKGLITQDPSLVEPARVAAHQLPPASPPAASSDEGHPLAPQPHCTPQIKAFAPSRAQALQPTTFTLSGTCLPPTLHLLMPDCAPVGAPQRTDTAIAFTCTPAEGAAKRSGILRERPDGPSLFSFVYDIAPAASPVGSASVVGSPAGSSLAASLPVAAATVASLPAASPLPGGVPPAISVALPPLPRQRAALDELLRASKAHTFRLEAVIQVAQGLRSGVKSAEEQACLDQKIALLKPLLGEANQRFSRLETASQSNDLPAAEPAADRIATLRHTADRVYLEAQRCPRLDD